MVKPPMSSSLISQSISECSARHKAILPIRTPSLLSVLSQAAPETGYGYIAAAWEKWLMDNMFDGISNAEDKANNVVENIGSHALTKSYSSHLHIDYLRNLGLNIKALEDDAKLQDKVLSIHHSTMITISSTKAAKIIENQNGVSFINTIG